MIKSFILALLFIVGPATAQEITTQDDKRHGQLQFNVPLNQPITINTSYKIDENGALVELSEVTELTALRVEGDNVVYRAKTTAANTISMTGVPPLMEETFAEIGEQAVGLSFEYIADATGYPLEITDTKPINKFMGKARKSLGKWIKKFSKKNKLSKAQRAQVSAIMDQSMAPYLSKDKATLSQLVLESPQLIFYGTGRGLYLDYYSVFNTVRYLEEAKINFHTIDEWVVNNWDAENGVAEIGFTQKINDEEFQAFLGRLRPALEAQKVPNIETTMAAFGAIKMSREGSYKMDMKTGLPISGSITSKSFVDGKSKTETIDFTISD